MVGEESGLDELEGLSDTQQIDAVLQPFQQYCSHIKSIKASDTERLCAMAQCKWCLRLKTIPCPVAFAPDR